MSKKRARTHSGADLTAMNFFKKRGLFLLIEASDPKAFGLPSWTVYSPASGAVLLWVFPTQKRWKYGPNRGVWSSWEDLVAIARQHERRPANPPT
jgi:hypothetical protein